MEAIYKFFLLTSFNFFIFTIGISQITIDIQYYDNRDVPEELYGFHMSNFFEQCWCYDPDSPGPELDSIEQCMGFAADLIPAVVRFPAGGDHKFMHLLDENGYGYREEDIDAFIANKWIKVSDATSIYDYIDKQNEEWENIRFLDRFINFLDYCEEKTGKRPKVIFVANVLLTKLTALYDPGTIEHANLEVMRYLMDNDVEIVGIELGNEHYDDKDTTGVAIFKSGGGSNAPKFNNYFQTCSPMLDSLDADPQFDTIPVALVAAPEPIHGAATGLGSIKVEYYADWNTDLKAKATNPSTSGLFDAYAVHIYNRPDDLPECYRMYYDDYVITNPNQEINTIIDDLIIPAWECAQDSFRNYTNETLQRILNNYAGSCAECLGNDKHYWITEWGLLGVENYAGEDYGISNLLNDTVAGHFGNTFIDAAYAFQYLLESVDYDVSLDGGHLADIDFMIKHNFMSRSIGGAVNHRSGTDPVEETDPWYIRRANYWPFYIMRDIFNKGYERIHTSIVQLDEEERMPFIKCFYYDNPVALMLPNNFCEEIPGGTSNPIFYMYFYNPYPDDITFKHTEMTGTNNETLEEYEPQSDNAAFMKYVRVDELYEHAGINQYMKDNDFYDDTSGVYPDMTGLSSEIFHLCDGDSIVLHGYSFGYVYWKITPEPYRIANVEYDTTTRVWPVPAKGEVEIAFTGSESERITIELYNSAGQLYCMENTANTGYFLLKRKNAPAGIYFFRLVNEDGTLVDTGRIIWD